MLNDVYNYSENEKTQNSFEIYENNDIRKNFYNLLIP